jgi:malonyl CoA-acyl carrier protein transacylase
MLHVNAFVEDLAKADRDGFQDAEQTIEQRGTEVRIVNEVVENAVDVSGNADRIDKTENEHDPKGDARKKIKHAEEVSAV